MINATTLPLSDWLELDEIIEVSLSYRTMWITDCCRHRLYSTTPLSPLEECLALGMTIMGQIARSKQRIIAGETIAQVHDEDLGRSLDRAAEKLTDEEMYWWAFNRTRI